jgi:hypothetical protein
MVEIELVRPGKEARQGRWLLTLDRRGVLLTDPEGVEVAAFAAAEAEQRFRLPSFWESVKELGVVRGGEDVVWFRPDKEAVREVRDYLVRSLAAQGPEVLASLRTRGWLYILGGVVLMALSIVALVVVENNVGNLSRGTRKLFIIPAIFGLIGVYRGLKTLRQCARAAQASQSEEAPSRREKEW